MNQFYNEFVKQLLFQKNVHGQDVKHEFLEKVKQVLDNAKKEMKDVSLDAISFKNKMNDIYVNIELRRKEADVLQKFINDMHTKIRDCENEIEKMKIRELDLLENMSMDKKERSQLKSLAIQRDFLNSDLENAKQKRLDADQKLSIMHAYIHEYTQNFKEQHQVI